MPKSNVMCVVLPVFSFLFMKRSLILVMALFSVLPCTELSAKNGRISIKVLFSSQQQLSSAGESIVSTGSRTIYQYPLPGATALLVSGTDTLGAAVSGPDGYCHFKSLPYGEYRLKLSYVGYETYENTFMHENNPTDIEVVMEEQRFILDEIKIKGEIPLIINRGDTVVINPKAVETQEGAAAIDIIKNVPGIEVTSTGIINAFGKPVQRTYVEGFPLFGKEVMEALLGVGADMVKSIDVYDETEITGTFNGRSESRKVRVMNIRTFRQFLSSFNGHLLAGIGAGLDGNGKLSDRLRYKGGASFNMFTRSLIVKSDIFTNNVGLENNSADYLNELMSRRFSGDRTLTSAGVKAEFKRGNYYSDGTELEVSYKYDNDRNDLSKRVEKEYFQDDNADSRRYVSEEESLTRKSQHEMKLKLNHRDNKKRNYTVYLNHQMAFDDGKENLTNMMSDIRTDGKTDIEDITSKSLHRWSLSEDAGFSYKEWSLSGSFSTGEDDGKELRLVDTDGTAREFESSPTGRNMKAGLRFRTKSLYLAERTSLTVNLESNYEKGTTERLRYDITDSDNSMLDELNSYSYTKNNWTNKAYLSFVRSRTNSNINVHAGFQNLILNDLDRLSSGGRLHKDFNSFYGNMIMGFGGFNFSFSVTQTSPSVEQMRSAVNDANPLYLTAGNPDLKAPFVYNAYVGYHSPQSSLVHWNVDIRAVLNDNAIVSVQRYYKDGAVLPEYRGYSVLPGATFTTYRNVGGDINASLNGALSTRLSSLRTKLDFRVTGEFMRRPYFEGDIANVSNTYSASVNMETYTSLKWMTLTLRSVSGYSNTLNTASERYVYFNQKASAKANVTLFRKWYINGTYEMILNEPLVSGVGQRYLNNVFNISTGLKLFKGRLTAGVSVFDIFDRSTDFRTMMYSDYVQNTWTPTFGRYVSFDVVFNLRKYR